MSSPVACLNGGDCEYSLTTDFPPTTIPFAELEQICSEATVVENQKKPSSKVSRLFFAKNHNESI